jgi:hypothetical protein
MKKQMVFRFAWLITVLAIFSLGCKLVTQVGEAVRLVTEVKGLATDIDLEGLSTEIDLGGLSTEIDLGSLATDIDLEGMSTLMATDMGIEELLTAIPLDVGTLVAATPAGFPADIPIMEGDKSNMGGSPTRIEYGVDAEVQDAVDFYRREMPARGWVEASGSTVDAGEAVLHFQKDNRKVTVNVMEDLFFGILVTITIEG